MKMCSARLLLLKKFRVYNKKIIDYEKLRKKSSPCGSNIRSRQHSLALFLSGGHSHGAVSECMR